MKMVGNVEINIFKCILSMSYSNVRDRKIMLQTSTVPKKSDCGWEIYEIW